jgi:5'(3')-deoxyribonucleotidase
VLLDVDGVSANYTDIFVRAVLSLGIRDIPPTWFPGEWDISKALKLTEKEDEAVYEIMNRPGIAQQIVPYPDAIESIQRLSRSADVYFVTSPLRTSPTWASDREAWLKKHFGDELGSKIVSTHYKYKVSGDIFVDDKPKHCLEWAKAWPLGIALHWAQFVNSEEKGLLKVYNWKMVQHLVDMRADQGEAFGQL